MTSIYLTAADGSRAAAGPARAVPGPAGHRRRPARPGAQLLAVRRHDGRHLPDQRQARAARRRQRLPEHGPAAGRDPGGGRAARRVRPRRRDRPCPADLRRHRHHTRPGHAARAGRFRRATARCGGSTAPAGRGTTRWPPRRTPCSPRCRAPASTSSTAPRAAGQPATELLALGLPPGATAYICGPTGFMSDMEYALTAAGLDPGRIRTELFGALPPINPGSPARPAGHRTSRTARPAPARWSRSRAAACRCRSTRPAAACSISPTPATSRSAGAAGPAYATPASPRCCPARSATSPDPLEDPPGGQVLICCAQPRTDIVLDL